MTTGRLAYALAATALRDILTGSEADRFADGGGTLRYPLTGDIVSFLGAHDDLLVDARTVYYVGGLPRPLAPLLDAAGLRAYVTFLPTDTEAEA